METINASCSEKDWFTALVRRDGRWWIGWIEEIAGLNSQERKRDELIENLHSALSGAIVMSWAAAVAEVAGDFEEVRVDLRGGDLRLGEANEEGRMQY
jgi:hypothetical protein